MSKNAPKPTIKQKIADLDQQIEWFYSEDFALDQATDHYRQALQLSQEIAKDLQALKNEIEVISQDFTKE